MFRGLPKKKLLEVSGGSEDIIDLKFMEKIYRFN